MNDRRPGEPGAALLPFRNEGEAFSPPLSDMPPNATWTTWKPLLETAGEPLEKLRAMLKLYSPSGEVEIVGPVDRRLVGVDAQSRSGRRLPRALDLRWKDALRGILTAGAADGIFHCPDPEGAAWRLMSLIDGLTVQVTVHKRMLTRARLFELVRTAAARELGLEPDQLA